MKREKEQRQETKQRQETAKRDKELRRLGRSELLELLVAQSEEIDRLRAELAKAKDALSTREIAFREAGSLADAAVKLSGVMKAAEDAAQIYLDSIKKMEAFKKAELGLPKENENRRV